MAEAMACGTPVVGFDRGSVPEVISNGVNGFVVSTITEAADAIASLDRIDRTAVRNDCESRFSDTVIVSAYEHAYRDLLAGTRQ
jgi:glycosyltransferase involved in cell wall biosynthesis